MPGRKTTQARLDVAARLFFALGILYVAALYLSHDLASRPLGLSAWQCYFVWAVSSVALLLSARHRVSLFVIVASSGVALLIVETTLEVRRLRQDAAWLAQVAMRTGADPTHIDRASKKLRAAGVDAYGLRCPVLAMQAQDTSLLPLAGWPFRYTLLGNELGYDAAYVADRYGFNNPDDVYDQPNGHAAVVVLGDSFAQGVAVWPNVNAAAALRRRGYNVLNLGCAGNGPLAALAAYREYGRRYAPDIVVWFYLESNDLADLARESGTLLANYLNPRFTQRLATRNEEIVRYLDRLPVPVDRAPWPLARVATLTNLRTLLTGLATDQLDRVARLRDVTIELQRSVARDGARLLVVYLPDSTALAGATRRRTCFYSAANCKSQVLRVFSERSIPVLDFERVLTRLDDPLSVFSFRIGQAARGHYTEEGYTQLGNAIADELAKLDDGRVFRQ